MAEQMWPYAVFIQLYESCVLIWFLEKSLTRRRIPCAAVIVLTFCLQFCRYLSDDTAVRCLVALCSDFIIILICYKQKFPTSYIYAVIFYDLMFFADSICAGMLYLTTDFPMVVLSQRTQQALTAVSRLLLPPLVATVARLWPEHDIKRLYLYPIPLLIYLAQLYISPYEPNSLFYRYPELPFIIAAVFMLLTLLGFIAAERERHRQEEYANHLEIMRVHNDEQIRYIKEMQRAYKSLSRHIHDARHHLDLLNVYVAENQWEQAQAYLNKLYAQLGNMAVIYTGNADVDSILYSKQLSCIDVKIHVQGVLPKVIPWLETVDLCALLANALTNAVEACEGIPSAIIEVVFQYRNWLIMTISNPYITAPKVTDGIYVSQKGAGHGLGIQNMREIAKKYNGHLKITDTNGIFLLDIMLHRGGE